MRDLLRNCAGAVCALALILVISGTVVAATWLAGQSPITQLLPQSTVMQFPTAILFVLCGISLIAGRRGKAPIAAGAGAAVLLYAVLVVTEYLVGRDFGIDTMFLDLGPTAVRFAPNTAVMFTFAGAALVVLALSRRAPWSLGLVPMLGALVTALGATAFIGYLIDFASAAQWAGWARMAIVTAADVVVLGAALVLAALGDTPRESRHQLPWLAASAGLGMAALSALAWYALTHAPEARQGQVANIVLTFGLGMAALLAGTIAQAGYLRRQAREVAGANDALRDSEERLQAVLQNVQTAVVLHGPDTRIRYVNPAAVAMLGLTRDQLLGKTAMDPYWHFVREDETPMPLADYPVNRVLASRAMLRDYVVGIRAIPDEPTRWALVNAIPEVGPGGALREIIVSFVDISERKRRAEEMEQLALSDSLTGLATRRHFLAEAERELARSRRAGLPMSLLMLDVDHFKQVNDQYGHAAGDLVLVQVARTLRAVLRDSDLSGRLGGEEFCVLLPATTEEMALEVAERLRVGVEAASVRLPDERAVRFTASVGVATLEPERDDLTSMLHRADRAMYRAKRTGRNRVAVLGAAVTH